ncbi:hypothetical protein AVI51_06025 [Piscirickettsia salmonis]|uniref:Uncharacterized protein n=3 Tax=Piscirickettsia salmonis TaxID=1238 RepID=A0A9Q6LPM1_PISSA|nr:hypothetical protein [Piscirickettsia salmonis]ALA25648.1 RNA helicase [Piscirickettsia salmonis]APS43144.1 hypothetical protein AVI48_01250 [Piscirickettsia salmonis]APS46491.1 hypothetical protein AVI49_01845 [Piscirickettsia salmonis]APS50460.1 hypothetical protein AVI50_06090 [Piscirickettsia salmonis]APS53662.1 hypothetical protein AVI51_06025 [Piscirickettsia salmonis]
MNMNSLLSVALQMTEGELIKDGQITFEQALEFTYDQQSVCESDAIRALIQQGILSFDLSLKLTGCQQRNLEAPVIAELLRSKDQRCRLTLEQALALDSVQRDNIKSKTVRALLQEGILPSIEKALSLTEEQRRSLVRPTVGKLLRSKDHFLHLTLEQALNIKSEQELTLASKDIRQLIQDRQITLEQALAFTSEQQRSCESGVIRALVQEGILSFDLSLKLTGCQQRNLEEPRVAELLRSKDEHCRLTLDQALRLMSWHKEFLQSKLTFKLIKDKKLTMEQALTLSYNQKCGLDLGVIYTLFRDGHLSFDQIVRMTDHQRWSLQIRGVDSLIARQIISAERYFSLDNTQRQALQDEGMIRRILRNEIAINDVIGVSGRNRRNARNLNGVQSTHVASVHQSISESASALIGLYGKSLEGKGLILTLDQIKNYVNGLGYDIKSKAARSTLLKLILENNPFIDQVSGVSTKEVLALAWLAIHDDSKRLGALDDAKARFVEALYEIQRGYNIGSDGKDSGGKDKPICAAGSFNKIVAKLQGVHPSCEIMHVTPAVAALKLLVVVREEAVRYIMSRPLETKQDLVDFVTLLKNVDEEKIKSDKGSVSIIYGDIKNSIAERMLGEFGRFLYPGGKNNLSFQGLIDSGSDVDVPDINVLQKITDSAAYQKYFKGKTSDATEGALSDEEQQAKEYLDLQRLQGIKIAILTKAEKKQFQFGYGGSKHKIKDGLNVEHTVPERVKTIFTLTNDVSMAASLRLARIKAIQDTAPGYQSGFLFLGRTQADTNTFIGSLNCG